jgi:hypothetical protein
MKLAEPDPHITTYEDEQCQEIVPMDSDPKQQTKLSNDITIMGTTTQSIY